MSIESQKKFHTISNLMFEYFTELRNLINKKENDLVNYLNKIYVDVENKFDSLIYAVSEDTSNIIEDWKLK